MIFSPFILPLVIHLALSGVFGPDWEIPKHLFHFGKQEYLLEDALIDTVPREAWDTFIMGDYTNNGLPDARRGLYGGTNINYISNFTPDCGSGGTPWFMVIHVADQCRGSEDVGDFRDILHSPEFENWFENSWIPDHPGSPFDSTRSFLTSAVDHQSEVGKFRIRYHRQHRIPGENAHTELHEEVLSAWIAHNGFRLMFNDLGRNDTAQDSQWYIRDLDCIEKIDGTPDDVLDWISQRHDFWRNVLAYGQARKKTDFDSPVIILLKALADLAPLDPAHIAALGRINAMVNHPDTPISKRLRTPLSDLLGELTGCEGKAGLSGVLQSKVEHYMNSCRPRLSLRALANEVEALCR